MKKRVLIIVAMFMCIIIGVYSINKQNAEELSYVEYVRETEADKNLSMSDSFEVRMEECINQFENITSSDVNFDVTNKNIQVEIEGSALESEIEAIKKLLSNSVDESDKYNITVNIK